MLPVITEASPVAPWWLLVALAGVFLSGAAGVWWLVTVLGSLKTDLQTAIRESREEGDEALDALAVQIRGDVSRLTDRLSTVSDHLHEHKLHVEKNFLSKDTANLVFGRLETSIGELAKMVEARLIRLDEKVERVIDRPRP